MLQRFRIDIRPLEPEPSKAQPTVATLVRLHQQAMLDAFAVELTEKDRAFLDDLKIAV